MSSDHAAGLWVEKYPCGRQEIRCTGAPKPEMRGPRPRACQLLAGPGLLTLHPTCSRSSQSPSSGLGQGTHSWWLAGHSARSGTGRPPRPGAWPQPASHLAVSSPHGMSLRDQEYCPGVPQLRPLQAMPEGEAGGGEVPYNQNAGPRGLGWPEGTVKLASRATAGPHGTQPGDPISESRAGCHHAPPRQEEQSERPGGRLQATEPHLLPGQKRGLPEGHCF